LDGRVLSAKRLAPARLAVGAAATLSAAVDTALAAGAPPSATALAAEATARVAPLLLGGGHGGVIGGGDGEVRGEPPAGVEPPPPARALALTHADSMAALGREEVGLGVAAAAAVVLADAVTNAEAAAAAAAGYGANGTSRRFVGGWEGGYAALAARLGPAVLAAVAAEVAPNDAHAWGVLARVAGGLRGGDGRPPPSSGAAGAGGGGGAPRPAAEAPSAPPTAAAARARVDAAVTAWRRALDEARVPSPADAGLTAAAVLAEHPVGSAAWGGLLAAPPVGCGTGEAVATRAVVNVLRDVY